MTDYYYLVKISLGDKMKKIFTLNNIIQVLVSFFIGASLYLKFSIKTKAKLNSTELTIKSIIKGDYNDK